MNAILRTKENMFTEKVMTRYAGISSYGTWSNTLGASIATTYLWLRYYKNQPAIFAFEQMQAHKKDSAPLSNAFIYRRKRVNPQA